jgi:hypothetical protein
MINAVNVGGKWGKKLLLGLLGVAAAFCMTGSAAHAQSKVQVFGGYSYGTNDLQYGCDCDPGLHGYAASFTYNLGPHVGLEGAFTGHNGTNTLYYEAPSDTEYGYNTYAKQNIYTYVGGPRLTLPVGNFSLYTHFLVGAAHLGETYSDVCTPPIGSDNSCYSEVDKLAGTGFTFKTGGGVDWNHGAWGIRILEVNYLHTDASVKDNQVEDGTTYNPSTNDVSGDSFEMAAGVTFNFGSAK